MDFRGRVGELKKFTDLYIQDYLTEMESSLSHPALKKLGESMAYSLKEGGQRIRPILSVLTAEALGHKPEAVLPFGAAVEFVHTYSLIHDDLPCMDDDDLRRGKLSNHKVF